MEAQFLDHYNRELGYLRELGSEFAQQYPAVAGRLGLDEFACADPFVERLLEGFAFLAARVHRRLDAEFPEFTHGLLESVYPHYTRPIPAATLLSLQPDADEGSLSAGYRLSRGTQFLGPTSERQPTPCRFDSTEDLELWPIRLVDVSLTARDAADGRDVPDAMRGGPIRGCLRLTIETTAGLPLARLALERLKWHFRGGEVAHQLFELLLAHTRLIAVRGVEPVDSPAPERPSMWQLLGREALVAEGLDDRQPLLPHPPRSFSGYRLLQEYFLLPEKFLAASIGNLQPSLQAATGRRLEIVIGLDAIDRELAGRVGTEHLALHCVPAVNLFKRRADRVQVSDRRHDQHLLVDRSRPMDFEIWSIESLSGHGQAPDQEWEFLPLYAPPQSATPRSGTSGQHRYSSYYTQHRRPRQPSENQRQYGHRSNYLGTEVFVTLTDSQQQPTIDRVRQLSSSVYCTNRDLVLLTPATGWRNALTLAGPGPVAKIECLVGPTRPRPSLASEDGERCWRLINHLTPNHLAFGGGTDANQDGYVGAAMLRETLTLYCVAEQPAQRRQVEGVVAVRHKPVTRQLPLAGPIVHGRGVEIDVEVDEAAFEGQTPFVLASILEQFFARHVTLNSFTQLSVRSQQRGLLHRWPVRMGTTPML